MEASNSHKRRLSPTGSANRHVPRQIRFVQIPRHRRPLSTGYIEETDPARNPAENRSSRHPLCHKDDLRQGHGTKPPPTKFGAPKILPPHCSTLPLTVGTGFKNCTKLVVKAAMFPVSVELRSNNTLMLVVLTFPVIVASRISTLDERVMSKWPVKVSRPFCWRTVEPKIISIAQPPPVLVIVLPPFKKTVQLRNTPIVAQTAMLLTAELMSGLAVTSNLPSLTAEIAHCALPVIVLPLISA